MKLTDQKTPPLTEFQKNVLRIISRHRLGVEEFCLRDRVYKNSWREQKKKGWRTVHIRRACRILESLGLIWAQHTSKRWGDERELITVWHRRKKRYRGANA